LKYYYNNLGSAKEQLAKGKNVTLPKVQSAFLSGAHEMGRIFGKASYWPSSVEMFGRAFESYIEDKIKEKGNTSQYLVHSTSNAAYKMFADPETGVAPAPYPEGEERKKINKAFDEFFKLFKQGKQFQKPSKSKAS
jgi:hypothetical protein